MSKAKENPNSFDRDHDVFPEVVDANGEVLTPEFVAFALSREGRRIHGKEYPNPVPMEPPIGTQPYTPVHELMAAMVRRALAERDGEEVETEDEANDFDVGDDFDPSSPHELNFEPTMPWHEAIKDIVRQAKEAYPDEKPAGEGGAQPPPDKPTQGA